MVLTAEQIKSNYDVLLNGIEKYVEGERKQQFLDFYNKLDERIALLPASHKRSAINVAVAPPRECPAMTSFLSGFNPS